MVSICADQPSADQPTVLARAVCDNIDKHGQHLCTTGNIYDYLSLDPATAAKTHVPMEIITIIAEELDDAGFFRLRLVNKRFAKCTAKLFVDRFIAHRVLYPTVGSFSNFLALLAIHHVVALSVKSLTLVMDDLRAPRLRYVDIWNQFCELHELVPTQSDFNIIAEIDLLHNYALQQYSSFTATGEFRSMLQNVFGMLSLKHEFPINHVNQEMYVYGRFLYTGEHLHVWRGYWLLPHLSFYDPDIPFQKIYYRPWLYDIDNKHSVDKDEYGDNGVDEHTGRLFSFNEDVQFAMAAAGTKFIFFHPAYDAE